MAFEINNLSAAQRQVVEFPIGSAMQVLASAGAGKTRVLVERIKFICSTKPRDGVIALTFTNKAAEEMQERLDEVDGIEDRCWIATVHSMAQKVVEQYGHTIGLPAELHIFEKDQDRKTVFLESLRNSGIDPQSLTEANDANKKDVEKVLQNYLNEFSIVKRELLSNEEIEKRYLDSYEFLSKFDGYQSALVQSAGIDYDDILVYAHKIFLEQPWCADIYRAKYKHVCIDEAQDLNKAQYEFIRALCGEKITSILMVGDPNQMIYGFNGSSDEFLCRRFPSDFGAKSFSLKENYRSSKAVVRLANKLMPGAQTENDFALEGISEIYSLDDEKAEANWVTDKIQSLLNQNQSKEIEGEIVLEKMVVIGRNRFVFKALEECLAENNIPYYLKKGERLSEPESAIGKLLDFSIRIKINPKDWINGKKLYAVLSLAPDAVWKADRPLEGLIQKLKRSETPLKDIYSKILEEIQGTDSEQPNTLKLITGIISVLDTARLSKAIEPEELEIALQEISDFKSCWLEFKRRGLGESLSSFRNSLSLGQLAPDSNPQGLMLSSVHTMKGLEKDIVFLIGMSEGTFPDYRAKLTAAVQEERNSAFVAVTRSRRWIYITYPKSKKMPWGDTKFQQPSRFLREMAAS